MPQRAHRSTRDSSLFVGPDAPCSHLDSLAWNAGSSPSETGTALLALYDAFFVAPEVELLELTATVVEKATELRAAFNVKTPDALHLASAIVAGAQAFLTGDSGLLSCTETRVEVL